MKKNKTRGDFQRQTNSNRLLAGITPRRCTFTGQADNFAAAAVILTRCKAVCPIPQATRQT
ncbi:TPA: hypothetical protein ACYUTL_005410 [Serratia marcescens]|uniref:hypothetical protein n=1 Tax=Serratia nevei TaxID=2703794 RepID=UPI0013D9C1D9|nr:hypothetical protein [Serratia marcescens]MBH2863869.1 hypothetical protein [Serratia marcescens]MBH3002635.1 hypothetical protein [Serratia marcescens]